ncbi:hypothetical protein [Nocardiopsis prasina]|uniref:hypothetical protein n=1 Tax=Nocardiopsis prasina TaxID=2015 RepID=UPI00034A0F7E|nr:hypothetical protein [Nocardiopsis prasina]
MRAFTRITTAAVLAGGMTFVGVGAAQADPKDEVAQPVGEVSQPAGEVAQPAEEATGSVENLSPEAEALLANPQVQEILADEEAVALLSDADSLKSLQALMELEDPTAALAALELPVATENLPVSAEEAPVATDEVTGQLPAEAPDTGDVTQPVEDVVGGVGLR